MRVILIICIIILKLKYNILKIIKYKKNNKILILHKNNNAIFLKITGFIKYFNNDKN